MMTKATRSPGWTISDRFTIPLSLSRRPRSSKMPEPVKIEVGAVYWLRNNLRARIVDCRYFKHSMTRPPYHAFVGQILGSDGRILRREAAWEMDGRYNRAAETELDIVSPLL